METRKLILLVDDNAAARRATRMLLLTAGYRVACAADGREALECLRTGELPVLILLDLSMPVLDGWQFRGLQRHDPHLCKIPVILLSGEEGLGRIAASLEVAGHLPKPVEAERLLNAIHVVEATAFPARHAS